MSKATVTTPDGQTVEVEIDAIALPEGYQMLAPDEAPAGYVRQDVMDAQIKTRLSRQKSSLKSDAGFVREVLEANGVPLDDDGKVSIPKPGKEVDIDALKVQITRELVDPLKGELETLQGTNARLLDAKKRSEIQAAGIKYGVREDLMKPVSAAPGAPSFWENMVATLYAFDAEHGTFAVRGAREDEFLFNPNGTSDQPYLDIDAHTASLRKDPQYSAFFRIEGQRGSGFEQNGSAGLGGTVSREDFSSGNISADQLEKIARGEVKVA